MSTLKIIKLQSGAFEHIDSIDGAFFLGRFNFKQEFNKAFLVEAYGAKRRTYGISDIEVYNYLGFAETFTNWTDLINRLVDLSYTGIDTNSIPSGGGIWGGISGTLSNQTDLQNALNSKQDVLTSTNFGTFSNSLTTDDTIPDAGIFNYTNVLGIQVKTTWANIKAKLKFYFDAIYQAILVSGTNIKTINGSSILGSGDLIVDSFDSSVLRQRMTNNNYGTSITDIGLSALSQVGTLSSVIKKSSVGNFIGVGSQSSATINSFAGWRDASGLGQAINFNAPFRYLVTFMFADPAPVANASSAIGFTGSSGLYSDFVNPSQITIGHNIGDTNLKIKSYNGSVVNIDLGANFPANTSGTDIYTFELNYKVTTCDYKVTRHNTGHVATGTFNVPSAILSVVPTEQINRTNNSTALATKIVFFGSKIKS